MREKQLVVRQTIFSIISLIVLYAIFYQWLDIPIATWAQQTFSDTLLFTLCRGINELFMPEMWLVLAIIIGITGIFVRAKKSRYAKSYFLFSFSIILSYVTCAILKVLLGRYRPVEYFTNHLYGFHFLAVNHNFTSSPSGVATLCFAGLYALAVIANRRFLTLLFMLLAVLISLSRIVVLDHYPSDIIFGAYLGILSVCWCRYLLSYKKIN